MRLLHLVRFARSGVLAGMLAIGCHRAADVSNPSGNSGASDASSSITDEQCQIFAQGLRDAVVNRRLEEFKRKIDWVVLGERATSGIEAPDSFRRAFTSGTPREGGSGAVAICQSILDAISQGASYRFIRAHVVNGEQRIVFRLLNDGSVNYHDYVLVQRSDGELVAGDMYILTTGEMLSDSVRRMYLQALANHLKASAGLGQNGSAESNRQFTQMSVDMQRGRFQEVLNRYESLTPQMQAERTVLLYRLMAAWNVDAEAYAEAVDAFCAHFPHDPSLHLNALDYFVKKRQFAKAYESIDEIQAAVGDDAYLHVFRAMVAQREGKLDAAELHAKTAIELEPDLPEAHEELLRIFVTTKAWANAVRVLSAMEQQTNMTPDLQTNEFSDFVQSQEYKDWVSERE
jgi:tetratricopeptide (TPR) repeat protein